MSGWRYIAERRIGDGTGTFLDYDVPLSDPTITDVLSGPGALSATIDPEYQRLKGPDGQPLFEKWSTCLWAECDGQIRGGGILTDQSFTGSSWSLDCTGFSGYPKDQPYTDSDYWIKEDPLDLARIIWSHLQSKRNGNLGVVLDSTTSPVRLGTELKQVDFDTQSGPVSFEAGPYRLAWYQTSDLGKEFDDLASQTPFDYHEVPRWSGDAIELFLQMGYPRLGRRRPELTFVVGDNVFQVPQIGSNADYANEILALGSGEGAAMIRGGDVRSDEQRLRRVKVITDKSWRSKKAANTASAAALRLAIDFDTVTEVVVLNHPNALIGSWQVGDEILVQSDAGWKDVAIWCRVLSSSISPASSDSATLTLQRAE